MKDKIAERARSLRETVNLSNDHAPSARFGATSERNSGSSRFVRHVGFLSHTQTVKAPGTRGNLERVQLRSRRPWPAISSKKTKEAEMNK